MCDKKIDFDYLQQILVDGIQKIQIDNDRSQCILFLGDTGVGKSTLMTYLMGQDLRVQQIGLKPALVGPLQSKIKIGHEKYSETSVPNRVLVNQKIFYDCPGFNDNKSQESDIANSFYLQRLFEMFQKTKIVMVIDQSYLTETRAYRLPSLIKKLRQSFGSLHEIMDSLFLIINKCNPDFSEDEIKRQFKKLLQTDKVSHFPKQDRIFFSFLLENNQYFLFPSPKRQQIGKAMNKAMIQTIMNKIDKIKFIHGTKINNIISDDAKLAIRDYVDDLTLNTHRFLNPLFYKLKLPKIRRKQYNNLYLLKEKILKIQQFRGQMYEEFNFEQFINLCDELLGEKVQEIKFIEQQLKICNFFQKIYNKVASYYCNLTNGILSGFSVLLLQIDKQIQIEKIEKQMLQKSLISSAEQIQRRNRQEEQRRKQKVLQQTINNTKLDSSVTIPIIPNERKRNYSIAETTSTTSSKDVDQQPFYDFTRTKQKFGKYNQKSTNPILTFKKKLIEAEYYMRSLRCEANTFHNKVKILDKNLLSKRA